MSACIAPACAARHEQQLELAVVERHLVGRELPQPRDRRRIADRTEEVFPIEDLAVRRDLHAVRAERVEILDALKEVRKVSEHIFNVLLDGVGRFRERAERRDIDEVPLAEFAHIERSWLHAHGGGRRLGGIRRDIQARGKVVRAAAGQIAHERAVFSRDAHHTVHRFVERAVAAVADDDVEFRPERFGELRRFSAVRGLAHGDEIARLGVDRGGVEQRCEGFGLSARGLTIKSSFLSSMGSSSFALHSIRPAKHPAPCRSKSPSAKKVKFCSSSLTESKDYHNTRNERLQFPAKNSKLFLVSF